MQGTPRTEAAWPVSMMVSYSCRVNGRRTEQPLSRAFPDKYRAAIVRAAEGCKVRKTLASPSAHRRTRRLRCRRPSFARDFEGTRHGPTGHPGPENANAWRRIFGAFVSGCDPPRSPSPPTSPPYLQTVNGDRRKHCAPPRRKCVANPALVVRCLGTAPHRWNEDCSVAGHAKVHYSLRNAGKSAGTDPATRTGAREALAGKWRPSRAELARAVAARIRAHGRQTM